MTVWYFGESYLLQAPNNDSHSEPCADQFRPFEEGFVLWRTTNKCIVTMIFRLSKTGTLKMQLIRGKTALMLRIELYLHFMFNHKDNKSAKFVLNLYEYTTKPNR